FHNFLQIAFVSSPVAIVSGSCHPPKVVPKTGQFMCYLTGQHISSLHYLRNHMHVLHNPVSIVAQQMADANGTSKQRKKLLTVGSLTAFKDHAVLLHAFSMISEEYPDGDLYIVGEGDLKQELEIIIKMLGIEDRVYLPGSNPSIYKEYIDAQLFVIPSRFESYSLVTAEVLAYGLPAVGFEDCAGVNRLIQSGKNGILVSGDNRAGALSSALKFLMSDKDKREQMGNNASLIKSNFDGEKVINDWETLLLKFCKHQ
ncbi:MAG: glycosyltransferase, partial [Proteobacteria bacterium]|nr:glycosyltransferase [Pseudomonadota bacterium]